MPEYCEFDVSLADVQPTIWRRFQLSADATFLDLHGAIQVACGWSNSHLFAFRDEDFESIAELPDVGFDDPEPDAATVPLLTFFRRQGDACLYEYDFGDSWIHDVVLKRMVELPERFERQLLDGARAFPPEDSGGLPGYDACVEVARGGDDPELTEWLGGWDPEHFDLDAVGKAFNR